MVHVVAANSARFASRRDGQQAWARSRREAVPAPIDRPAPGRSFFARHWDRPGRRARGHGRLVCRTFFFSTIAPTSNAPTMINGTRNEKTMFQCSNWRRVARIGTEENHAVRELPPRHVWMRSFGPLPPGGMAGKVTVFPQMGQDHLLVRSIPSCTQYAARKRGRNVCRIP